MPSAGWRQVKEVFAEVEGVVDHVTRSFFPRSTLSFLHHHCGEGGPGRRSAHQVWNGSFPTQTPLMCSGDVSAPPFLNSNISSTPPCREQSDVWNVKSRDLKPHPGGEPVLSVMVLDRWGPSPAALGWVCQERPRRSETQVRDFRVVCDSFQLLR